tara:strand:+ start:221 stop:835 length:615 start_codon:yes stop_codon:yes gene_type:complete
MFKVIPKNYPPYFGAIPKTMFNPFTGHARPDQKTIKSCSGFINLYKRSILVSSPFDIYLEFDENKIITEEIGKTGWKITTQQNNAQLLNYANSKNYKFLIKLELPIYLKSDASIVMLDSFYHFNKYEIIPGIINKKYESIISFFMPVKKRQTELYIKQGDPLFLIVPMCEDKIKLKIKKNNNVSTQNTILTFSSLKEFVMDKLT